MPRATLHTQNLLEAHRRFLTVATSFVCVCTVACAAINLVVQIRNDLETSVQNRKLVRAILRNDVGSALRALDHGATASARESDHPLSLLDSISGRLPIGHRRTSAAHAGPGALWLAFKNAPNRCPDVTLTRALLEHGADVNERYHIGGDSGPDLAPTVLFAAVFYARDADLVRLLLNHGADTSTCNELGYTALTMARDVGITHELLEHGANVNTIDRSGESVNLTWALDGGHADIVELLLRYGADPDARLCGGLTAKQWLAQVGPDIFDAATRRKLGASFDTYSHRYMNRKRNDLHAADQIKSRDKLR